MKYISNKFKISFILLLCCFEAVITQNCSSPIISNNLVCGEPKSSVDELLKIFTTTLSLQSAAANYNSSLFFSPIKTLYSSTLSGFKNIELLDEKVSGNIIEIKYKAFYQYSDLKKSKTNQQISNTIGNLSFIRSTLNKDPEFKDHFQVESTVFDLKENDLCNEVECTANGSPYVSCVENGLDICCQSICCELNNQFCKNGGYCWHTDFNLKPKCSCPVKYNSWYVGERCQIYLHIWMLIVFCTAFVFILLGILVRFGYVYTRLKNRDLSEILEKEEKHTDVMSRYSIFKNKLKKHFNLSKDEENSVDALATTSAGQQSFYQINKTENLNGSFQVTDKEISLNSPVPLPRSIKGLSNTSYVETSYNLNHNYQEEIKSNDQDSNTEILHDTTSQSSFDDVSDDDDDSDSNEAISCTRSSNNESYHPYSVSCNSELMLHKDLVVFSEKSSQENNTHPLPLVTTV